ncbi:hypothetical protein [Gayadomonas joobiniege]|uniref:hypothetical protein n=1 Tax=Gayadomonas joobiniege TaxID=1234606 RepID=UPI00037F6D7E|nr:hypothetical protein [Gayadomonas joobiniege]
MKRLTKYLNDTISWIFLGRPRQQCSSASIQKQLLDHACLLESLLSQIEIASLHSKSKTDISPLTLNLEHLLPQLKIFCSDSKNINKENLGQLNTLLARINFEYQFHFKHLRSESGEANIDIMNFVLIDRISSHKNTVERLIRLIESL